MAVEDRTWLLCGVRVGDDNAEAVRVASFDKGDVAGLVYVHIAAHLLQCLLQTFQALVAFGGPHQQVVAQTAGVSLSMFAAFDDVQLEAFSGQEKGGFGGPEGYFAFEQVSVKIHGPVKFGYVQDRTRRGWLGIPLSHC